MVFQCILFSASNTGLHYLTFIRRSLDTIKKKLTPIWMTNSAGMNSKNIVTCVGFFNDNTTTNNLIGEYYQDEQCLLRIGPDALCVMWIVLGV